MLLAKEKREFITPARQPQGELCSISSPSPAQAPQKCGGALGSQFLSQDIIRPCGNTESALHLIAETCTGTVIEHFKHVQLFFPLLDYENLSACTDTQSHIIMMKCLLLHRNLSQQQPINNKKYGYDYQVLIEPIQEHKVLG